MTPFLTRGLGDIIAEIHMSNTVFGGGYLLVEGSSDCRFFKSRIWDQYCQIVMCGTKKIVIDASKLIKNTCNSNALGIVDDDFDSIFGVNYLCNDLIATDTHDLETLMLNSAALNSVIQEYADAKKLTVLEKAENKSFIDCFISRTLPFGKLRYINAANNFNVSFENYFSPWKFIDHKTWILDEEKLLNEFATHSNQNIGQMSLMYASISSTPCWNFIQGHDAVDILAIAFRNVIKGSNNVCAEDICSALRLAFHRSLFQDTALHKNITQWEASNLHQILKV